MFVFLTYIFFTEKNLACASLHVCIVKDVLEKSLESGFLRLQI